MLHTRLDPSFRPDETDAEIFSEHTWLQGAFLGSVAYGMEALTFFMALNLLWKARSANKTRNYILIGYMTLLFALSTAYMVALLEFTQLSFIDDRNYTGIENGPNGFETFEYSLPIDLMGNVVMVIITWFCDVINVWRCSVIYTGWKFPVWTILALPCTMYLASLVVGGLFMRQVALPASSPYFTTGINWTIPYYTMSLALNILITILIVVRLLMTRAQINRAMGKKHGSQYTSLAAMVVESAAIYSTFSLLFLVPFALQTPTGIAFSQISLQTLSPVQVFSTFLIFFRVAQGRSWSQETATIVQGKGPATRTIGSGSNSRNMSQGMQFRTNTAAYTDTSITLKTLDATATIDYHEGKGGTAV